MMNRLLCRIRRPRIGEDAIEREKMARLEAAEREVKALQVRGDRAVRLLVERHDRNHWRESIERMIQGVH